ncbi:hypothetical protein BpHYR1_000804 [Brachionus plicatilis]|uniref:Uncharacterized protein n=1 Tax=Brachionus plicatilis TaxID=10195 RepID=A0A3M7PH24_BRAPC|nr:hypothetical protein BpHYR1_000804 [Brachionus plicatilis]
MQKVESNTIKSLVGVRRRKRSTWLLAALGLNKISFSILILIFKKLKKEKFFTKWTNSGTLQWPKNQMIVILTWIAVPDSYCSGLLNETQKSAI